MGHYDIANFIEKKRRLRRCISRLVKKENPFVIILFVAAHHTGIQRNLKVSANFKTAKSQQVR